MKKLWRISIKKNVNNVDIMKKLVLKSTGIIQVVYASIGVIEIKFKFPTNFTNFQ